jgi:putative copper export protein
VLLATALALVAESWRHHVFIAFWFFGLPFLRWLRGSRQSSLVVRERELELTSGHWLGGPLILPRTAVASIVIGRAGFTRLFQRALVIQLKDRRTGCLFVGLSSEQAEFVEGGLLRWLAADF